MRKLTDFLIAVYLLPLRMSNRLALYVKGKILQYDGHYAATVDVIRKKFPHHQGLVVDIGAYDADSTVFFCQRVFQEQNTWVRAQSISLLQSHGKCKEP